MQTMTHSRLRAFRKCPQFHHLRYVEGWMPTTTSDPLGFGTMLHRGIEGWWTGAEVLPESDDAIMQIKASEIIYAYTRYAWPDRDDYEVLAVEKEQRYPLLNPDTMKPSVTYEMASVMDLILRRKKTGEIILVEHKTTGSDFSDDAADYWRRLAMDSQLSIYVVAAEAAEFPVDRIIYDVIARPMIRRKLATPVEERKYTKATATAPSRLYAGQREADESDEEFRIRLRDDIDARPERYFGRREIVRTESEILDGMRDVWAQARMIRDAELSGRHPRNPDACHNMGTCEYYDVCAFGVNPAESTMFQKAAIHAELTEGGANG